MKRYLQVLFFCLGFSAPCLFAGEIHTAASEGNLALVEKCLTSSPKLLEDKDDKGATPLMVALMKKQEAIADFLINKGASLKVTATKAEVGPLHVALVKRCTKIARLLIEKGIDIQKSSKDGLSPLHFAAMHKNVEILDLLLSKGADIAAQDGHGGYPAHFGAGSLELKHFEKLLGPKVDISVAEKENGWTPLIIAASMGNEEVFFFLLGKGAKTDISDAYQATMLHHAVNGGKKKIVAHLLQAKAPVNALDKNQFAPIHVAAGQDLYFYSPKEEERLEILELLLKHGSDLTLKDKRGRDPLAIATEKKLEKVKAFLEKAVAGLKK